MYNVNLLSIHQSISQLIVSALQKLAKKYFNKTSSSWTMISTQLSNLLLSSSPHVLLLYFHYSYGNHKQLWHAFKDFSSKTIKRKKKRKQQYPSKLSGTDPQLAETEDWGDEQQSCNWFFYGSFFQCQCTYKDHET